MTLNSLRTSDLSDSDTRTQRVKGLWSLLRKIYDQKEVKKQGKHFEYLYSSYEHILFSKQTSSHFLNLSS
jgi:hypothetical protein